MADRSFKVGLDAPSVKVSGKDVGPLADTGTPADLGTAARGSSTQAARADHVHNSSGASGAPTDATYITVTSNGSLSAERVLTAGDGVTLTDNSGAGTMTIAAPTDFTWVVKTSDESVTSSTTFQNDDALTFSVSANSTYVVDGCAIAQSASSTPNIKFQFTYPSGATLFYEQLTLQGARDMNTVSSGFYLFGNDAASPAPSSTMFVNAVDQPFAFRFRLVLVVASTSGSLTLQWAQNTSNSTAMTLKAGSFLSYRKVA